MLIQRQSCRLCFAVRTSRKGDLQSTRFAVNKICSLRGPGDESTQIGNSCVRNRKTPTINFNSKKLADLIDWTSGVTEPPLTLTLMTMELRQLVKRVTEAAAHVYTRKDKMVT